MISAALILIRRFCFTEIFEVNGICAIRFSQLIYSFSPQLLQKSIKTKTRNYCNFFFKLRLSHLVIINMSTIDAERSWMSLLSCVWLTIAHRPHQYVSWKTPWQLYNSFSALHFCRPTVQNCLSCLSPRSACSNNSNGIEPIYSFPVPTHDTTPIRSNLNRIFTLFQQQLFSLKNVFFFNGQRRHLEI